MYKNTVTEIRGYITALFNYDRRKFGALVFLTSALGVFEGIGIVLIAPLLATLGVGADNNINRAVTAVFSYAGVPLNLYTVLACYAAVVVAQNWLQRVQAVRSAVLQRGFGRKLSNRLFAAAGRASWSFWLCGRKSDVIHLLTDEVSRVITGTVYFVQIASAILVLIVQIAIAVGISPLLTLLAAVSGLVLYFASLGTVRRSRALGWNLSAVYKKFHGECQEYLGGIKEIKACNKERQVIESFATLGAEVDDKIIRFSEAQNNASFISKMTSSFMLVLFMLLAARLVNASSEYILIMLYIFSRIWPRFATIQNNLHFVIMMLPSFATINSYIRQAEACREPIDESSARLPALHDGIEINAVDFYYGASAGKDGGQEPEKPVKYALKDISLKIPANSTVALVGESGSGKSTLADLLIGLHRPVNGEILVDGQQLDARLVPLWRNSLAYVAQDAFLLNDTIRNNLLWGNPAADDEIIKQCLRQACAWEFISALPQGLDSIIGDRGIRLSGGERQRLVLARALLRQPLFLLLDEATSALDNENELKIKQSLDELRGKLTVFVIAHRLTTIEHADLVVVLDNGKIVEQGSYAQLMADESSHLSRLANPGGNRSGSIEAE